VCACAFSVCVCVCVFSVCVCVHLVCVCVCLCIASCIAILILNIAIVAHQQRVEERNSDYKRISSYFALPDTPAKNKGTSLHVHYA